MWDTYISSEYRAENGLQASSGFSRAQNPDVIVFTWLSRLLPTSRSLSSSKNSNEMVCNENQQIWSFERSWTSRRVVLHIWRAFSKYELFSDAWNKDETRVWDFLRKASWSSAAELFKYAEQLYFVSAWIIQKLDKFENVISIKRIISREDFEIFCLKQYLVLWKPNCWHIWQLCCWITISLGV